MLIFVGLGLEQSPTLRALDELKNCDIVYFESYTSPVLNEETRLETILKEKTVERVKREFVEETYFAVMMLWMRSVSVRPLSSKSFAMLFKECSRVSAERAFG